MDIIDEAEHALIASPRQETGSYSERRTPISSVFVA